MSKNLYSVILVVVVSLISKISFAATPSVPTFKNGFYLGAMVGEGFGHADWKGSTVLSAVNDAIYSQSIYESWVPQGDTKQSHTLGRVFSGYQIISGNLSLAAEIGGTFGKDYHFEQSTTKSFRQRFLGASGPQENIGTSTTYTKATLSGNELNIDLKPGVLLKSNLLAYGIVGMSLNSLKMVTSGIWINNVRVNTQTGTLSASDSTEHSHTALGVRLGLGTEYALTENWGVSLNYVFTQYRPITTQINPADRANSDGAGGGVIVLAPVVSPLLPYIHVGGTHAPVVSVNTQTAYLGLHYHF